MSNKLPWLPLTVKQVDCNFELSADKWNQPWDFVGPSSVPGKKIQLKRGCKKWPGGIHENFTPIDKLADENGYCVEGEKMEIWGDPMNCPNESCQWWSYRIDLAVTRNINGSSIDPTCTGHMISQSDISNYLKFVLMRADISANESDYDNPFTTLLEYDTFSVGFENHYDNNGLEYSLITSKLKRYIFKNIAIKTDARNIGISYLNFAPSVVNKLQYDSYTAQEDAYVRKNLTDPREVLYLAFTLGIRHREIERTYPS